MNWVIFATCFAATLTVACATTCRKAEDCPEGHCCVALSLLQLQRKGLCLKLARKGKACSEPESQLDYYGGKYTRSCPCQEGFSCLPKKLKADNTDQGAFLASLRCQEAATTPEPEITPAEEIAEVTPEEEIAEETPEEEIAEETPEEGIVDEGEGQEEVVDEGTGDEVVDEGTGDEVVDEGTGDEEVGEEIPAEIAEGPGGEKPRDDDCIDWEYPC